ncbi:MAG: M56 family metallopeptidase, partial [Acidobacteriota bacterium]
LTPIPTQLQESLNYITKKMALTRAIQVYQSIIVEVPTVIGFLRPIILIPTSALTGLSLPQLEAVLCHELAHIKRHDYIINLLQSIVETLMFYHPAIWWIGAQIRRERENICDDLAVAAAGDTLLYARALVRLEELRGSLLPALALGANGGQLLSRVLRLTKPKLSRPSKASSWIAIATLLIPLFGILTASQAGIYRTSSNSNLREAAQTERKVAIIFVGLPIFRSSNHTLEEMQEITEKLLKTISTHKIPAVGFVGEIGLHKEGEEKRRIALLRAWLNAGLELGNQTYSHLSLYRTDLAEYQADVIRGEQVTRRLLEEQGKPLKYFLYPYLNTGSSLEKKTTFEQFLAQNNYIAAPVTIDNMDWLFANVYCHAMMRKDYDMMLQLSQDYVPYMERMFEFYEQMSRDLFQREVPQVLMLMASSLNADQLDRLLIMLKSRGYKFISLDQALADPAYTHPDNYVGPVGISWLQRWSITRGNEFRKEPSPPYYLRQSDSNDASGWSFKSQIN